jgi:hypothetical protein
LKSKITAAWNFMLFSRSTMVLDPTGPGRLRHR